MIQSTPFLDALVIGAGISGLTATHGLDGRAPDDVVLLTIFSGGRRDPEVATASDENVAAAVRAEIAALLRARGPPLWQEVVRWPRAIPQNDLGHLDRLRRIDAAEAALPGLFFYAHYRGGVAVGDRIKHGHLTATQVDAFVAGKALKTD